MIAPMRHVQSGWRFVAITLCLGLPALPLFASTALDMPPGARLITQEVVRDAQINLPVGAFEGEQVPMRALRGAVTRQAWHVTDTQLAPFQVIDRLTTSLLAAGYRLRFDCAADACGGFDFRFAIDVMDAPDMFVNLRGFHFASFERGGGHVHQDRPDDAVTLLASRTQNKLYLQITYVGAPRPAAGRAEPEPGDQNVQSPAPISPNPRPVAQGAQDEGSLDAGAFARLREDGFVVLDGVDFEPGATRLTEGAFEVLTALAQFLETNPELRIALVGHTDSTGALQSNIRISKARAEAVRAAMLERYDLDGARIDAEGMGYLAPRASNLTEAGRAANRRVEAILLSAE